MPLAMCSRSDTSTVTIAGIIQVYWSASTKESSGTQEFKDEYGESPPYTLKPGMQQELHSIC